MDEELEEAISAGDLPRVMRLVQGGATIAGTSDQYSALHQAVVGGRISIVEWLLAEGWANVSDVTYQGCTALLLAASRYMYPRNVGMVQWLLEHGGADIKGTTPNGRTVWDLLRKPFVENAQKGNASGDRLTPLLRAMVLRSAPPTDLVVHMYPQHSRVAEEGARLRAGLLAYLARRRALLAEHTSLIAPLRALVSSYEEPTTTEELWATGLGALVLLPAGIWSPKVHVRSIGVGCFWMLVSD
jgi:hypothetical protein